MSYYRSSHSTYAKRGRQTEVKMLGKNVVEKMERVSTHSGNDKRLYVQGNHRENHMQNKIPYVYVMVATYNRSALLQSRSLPSIAKQSHSATGVVLVDDSSVQQVKDENHRIFRSFFPTSPDYVYLANEHTPGAAGSWNQGLDWILMRNPDAWIAILDDDDEWSDNHIKTCISYTEACNLVLSGITTVKDGKKVGTQIPKQLDIKDFFQGNSGWQGSNTFIRASFLKEIGGFDESLVCTHDRDLAVRCLHHPHFRYTSTGRATVKFFLDTDRESLTMPEGHTKITGLLQFFAKHSEDMDVDDERAFKQRAELLFHVNPDLFSLVNIQNEYPGFPRAPIIGKSPIKRWKAKIEFKTKKRVGKWRANTRVTRLLGPSYKRSRDQIEIDLTYACNLRCHDCNRSCRQAPQALEISLDRIRRFVSDSIERGIEWKRVRLLGGEPTLHSRFEDILFSFAEYKKRYPRTRLELVTNGYGRQVLRKLLQVPPFFHIENSMKRSDTQTSFYSFNNAPCDRPEFRATDFTNGCSNLEKCGMGLTPLGYYPCAISGGIDRIAGWNIGQKEIPEQSDDMLDILAKACPLCGRFASRVFIPYDIMPKSAIGQVTESWEHLYDEWNKRRRVGG